MQCLGQNIIPLDKAIHFNFYANDAKDSINQLEKTIASLQIRPGSVHLIKLVEGLLDLITGVRTLEQLELDLPPWAEGPCDHSIAPWDESAGVRASTNLR